MQATGSRVPSARASHSTPWSSGSLAANLAHSSATSLPGIPLCAGHHRISISKLAQGCNRLSRLDGVGLTGAGLVMRHPCNRGLGERKDADSAEFAALFPLRCHRQSTCDGRAMPPGSTPCGPPSQPIPFPSPKPPRCHVPGLTVPNRGIPFVSCSSVITRMGRVEGSGKLLCEACGYPVPLSFVRFSSLLLG